MKESIFLSVVIPAYNEVNKIGSTLDQITGFFKDSTINYEIIVVDDGSTDNTLSVLKSYKDSISNLKVIENVQNKGKGYSVKRGILISKGRYVLFFAADLSIPLDEIWNLLNYIKEGYDIIIGSKWLPKSYVKYSRHNWLIRLLASFLFKLIVKLLVHGISDTQCGFKCFKGEVASNLFSNQRLIGFSFDVEILYLAQKYGYKIKEFPVRCIYPTDSKVKVSRDSLVMFLDLFRIKINDWLRRYNQK